MVFVPSFLKFRVFGLKRLDISSKFPAYELPVFRQENRINDAWFTVVVKR